MKDAIIKISAYQLLIKEVENTRAQKFEPENQAHSDMLVSIWIGIKGENDKLESKITKRWTEIGFQGTNPSTDFRGMGLLALDGL